MTAERPEDLDTPDWCDYACERMRPGDVQCPDCGAEAQPEEED